MAVGDFQVLVAFNNNPMDDPALITTVAAPGTAGGAAPTLGANNVWTDISQYVKHYQIKRGRQHELARFESGSLTVDLWNMGAVFNPWNTSGPFYGLLLPGKLIQVRRTVLGTIYYRFTGMINAWPIMWPTEMEGHAQIQANDAFRSFALADVTSTQYATMIKNDGATAYFRLGDPPNSIQLVDATGNGHIGTPKFNVTLAYPGALLSDTDTAIDLGKYAGWVDLDAGAAASGSAAFSFDGWVKLHGQPNSANSDRIYGQADPATGIGIALYVQQNSGTPSGPADLYFEANDGTTFTTIGISSAQASLPYDNLWHHFACVRSSDGKTYYVFIDGVLKASGVASGVANIPANPPTCRIGGDALGNPALWGAVDEFAIYAGVGLTQTQVVNHYLGGPAQWANQTSGTRIGNVLNTIGWSAGARNIDTGFTTVQAVITTLTSTKSLTHMQLVEQTEDGALYMTGDGKVRFVARQNIVTNNIATVVTFGDGGGQIPFMPAPDMALDDLDVWNEVTVTRLGFQEILVASDAASITANGRRTQPLSGLLLLTDQEAYYQAQYTLAHFKNPTYRLRQFKVRLLGQSNANLATLLGMDLLSRVSVQRAYIPGGGTAFSQSALIENTVEDYDVEGGDWTIAYAVSPSDAIVFWILDDTTYSVLDTSTIPGY